MSLARFSAVGIDVHKTGAEQLLSDDSCLACSHRGGDPMNFSDWRKFQTLMEKHHSVKVPDEVMPSYLQAWSSKWEDGEQPHLEVGRISISLVESPMGWLVKVYGLSLDAQDPVNLRTKNLKTAKKRAESRAVKLIKKFSEELGHSLELLQ